MIHLQQIGVQGQSVLKMSNFKFYGTEVVSYCFCLLTLSGHSCRKNGERSFRTMTQWLTRQLHPLTSLNITKFVFCQTIRSKSSYFYF